MNSSIVIASVFGLVCAMARAAQPATPVAVATPAVRSGSVPASCPAAVPFPDGVEAVKAIRVFKAANGESAFESVEFKGESKAYFKPGELFSHTLFANAAKVQIVSGPPNVTLPLHAPPGKEIFLTIQGSSTVVLPNGQEQTVLPGTVVIFDDGGSKTGHAGRTGPCGYVAINIAFPDSANNP
jgi:quercetin dioxygenase-like cupin family protein